jgi:hypothetical protein
MSTGMIELLLVKLPILMLEKLLMSIVESSLEWVALLDALLSLA